MDKPDSKIHKLAAKAGRRVAPSSEPSETDAREESPSVRYVAVPDYASSSYLEDDHIDLFALWQVLAQYRRVLATVMLIGLLLGIGYAFLATPIYRAELVMAPVVEEEGGRLASIAGQFGGLASLAGVNLGSGGKDVDKVLATLTSRAFLVPFLEQEKIIPLFRREFDHGFGNKPPTSLDVYEAFSENVLDIHKDSKSGLVTLSIEWQDPALAARWANHLVARLNEHQRQLAIQEAQQSIDYLNQQLTETSVVDMQQSIYRLIESQTKVIMLANVKKEYAMQVIDPALAPEKPRRPQRTLVMVLSAMLSLLAGVFLVFLLHGVKNFKQRMAKAD